MPAPKITTTSPLPQATSGTPYSYQLEATGGAPPYIWTIVEGSLPAGLTMSSSGLISGTPTSATNTFSFKVNVASSDTPFVDIEAPIEILDFPVKGETLDYFGNGVESPSSPIPAVTKAFGRSEFLFDPDDYSDGTNFYFEAVVTNRSFTESRYVSIEKQMRGRTSSGPTIVHQFKVPPQVYQRRIRFSEPFKGFLFDDVPPNVNGPSVTGAINREDAYRVVMQREAPHTISYPAGAIFPSAEFELHKLRLIAFSSGADQATIEVPLTSVDGGEDLVLSGLNTAEEQMSVDENVGCEVVTSASYIDLTISSIWPYNSSEWATLSSVTVQATMSVTGASVSGFCGLYDKTSDTLVAEAIIGSDISPGPGPATFQAEALTGSLIDGHEYVVRGKVTGGALFIYKARLRIHLDPALRENVYWRYATGKENWESRIFYSLLQSIENARLFAFGCGDETVIAGVKAILVEGTGYQNAAVTMIDAGSEDKKTTISGSAEAHFRPEGGLTGYPGWFGYTSGDHIPAQNWTVDENFGPIVAYNEAQAIINERTIDDIFVSIWAFTVAAWQFELLAAWLGGAAAAAGVVTINALRDTLIADSVTDMTDLLTAETDFVPSTALSFTASGKTVERAVVPQTALIAGNRYYGSPVSSGLVHALLVIQLDVENAITQQSGTLTNGQVLLQRVFKSPTDLIYEFNNDLYRVRNLCFDVYFFNLMWEYSAVLRLTEELTAPPAPVLEVVSVVSKIITIRTDLISQDDTKSVLVELSPSSDFQGFKICVKGGPLQSVFALQIPTGVGFTSGWFIRAKRQDYLGDSDYSDVLFVSQAEIDGSTPDLLDAVSDPLNNLFSYTSDDDQIDWTWSTFTLTYPDGFVQTIGPGSASFTGLTPSSTYKFYPYLRDARKSNAVVILPISTVSGGTGDDPDALATQTSNGSTPLSRGAMEASTTSGGAGSGSGGGIG